MQTKACLLLFAALCLQPCFGFSQAIADSSQYRQAKLGIWCETTRFIYIDNGADSLLQTLNCRNWDALQASMQQNELGAQSFFNAIEKPEIYAGYTTYDAKLSKLIEEISKRLKASRSRQARDPQLRGVDSLQRKLASIAINPAVFAPPPAGQVNESLAVNQEAQNETRQQVARELPGETEEALEEEAGIPLLEIVQWGLILLLTGLLGWLFKRNATLEKELNLRMARRKQEIATLAVKKDKEHLPVAEEPRAPVPAGMQEKEVLRLIRKELDRFRQQQQMKANRPAAPANLQKPLTSKKEMAAVKEPVQVPVESKPVAPAEAGIFFDKLPFKGGFHQNHLSRQPHPDSIYTIQVLQERPEEAAFWVTEDHDVQKYAMQNGLSFFEEACDYSQVEESPSRVRNLEKGLLRKKGHLWQIEKKAKVSFE